MMAADMEVSVLIDEGLEESAEESWLRSVAEQVLADQDAGSDVEVSLVITGQEGIRELNRTYRGIDEPTDVLSFCMLPAEEKPDSGEPSFVAPPDGVLHLGEVIISYPQAAIQAGEHRHSVKKEITILIIHGVFHLLGYDHDTPEHEQDMRTRELAILNHIEGGS